MKVLIVSDTHGRDKYLFQTIQKVKPIDLMIHLGDFGGTAEYIKSLIDFPVEMVSGNNDLFIGQPKDKVIRIGDYTVYLTHGHKYGVYYNTYQIKEAARIKIGRAHV